MRTFQTEFVNHVISEDAIQQASYGSMKKVNYHAHYLAQESLTRMSEYRDRGFNRKRGVEFLVRSFISIMGEYAKYNDGGSDFNKYYIGHVKDEADRRDNLKLWDDDLVEANIKLIVEYCRLSQKEKRKNSQRLITIGANILREYSKEVL